jgi:flavorubredoxin
METHSLSPDVTVLSDHVEVPGIGFLPVNTFVLHAEQPVVVDTGLSTPDKDFVSELARVIDPADVRWIWITHPDRDHTGGLWSLLDAAPNARLVTTFLGMGIMSCEWIIPLDRVYLLNPDQQLHIGDRTLTGYRPPLFDNPATVGFLDSQSGTFFSSDCFGGPMSSAEQASAPDVRAVSDEERRTAQLLWAAIDSPWVHNVDVTKYAATVDTIRALDPSAILSTHLPPAVGLNDAMFDVLDEAPTGPEFVGPDQQALEAMLASFEPVPS